MAMQPTSAMDPANTNKWGVYIGRFQPFHNGHLASVLKSLNLVDNLLILIGSCDQQDTEQNPWSGYDRYKMIFDSLHPKNLERIRFGFLPDFGDDEAWVNSVKYVLTAQHQIANPTLLGLNKDASTYYLNLFPEWNHIEVETGILIDATSVRELYFLDNPNWKLLVPEGTRKILLEHKPS